MVKLHVICFILSELTASDQLYIWYLDVSQALKISVSIWTHIAFQSSAIKAVSNSESQDVYDGFGQQYIFALSSIDLTTQHSAFITW